jgi:hypothetical protein
MLASPFDSWILLAIGSTVVAAGLFLLLWSLFSDRARGRRRCPKCSYHMRGVPGLTCPECGQTAPEERALFRTRRRWRTAAAASLLLIVGAITLAHTHIRTTQGGWWSALPTPVLLRLVDNESLHRRSSDPRYWERGPRAALWARVSGDDPSTGLGRPAALSMRNWQRLVSRSREIILSPTPPPPGQQMGGAKSWATVTLGSVVPHENLVDPVIRELLLHERCSVRYVMVCGVYPYYFQRGHLSPHWIDALAQIACDPACLVEASTAANILARTGPLPVEQLNQIITCISADPALAGVWTGLQSGLSAGYRGAPLEVRLAYIATLEASDDPAIRQQAAALRNAVETAWQPPISDAADEES